MIIEGLSIGYSGGTVVHEPGDNITFRWRDDQSLTLSAGQVFRLMKDVKGSVATRQRIIDKGGQPT